MLSRARGASEGSLLQGHEAARSCLQTSALLPGGGSCSAFPCPPGSPHASSPGISPRKPSPLHPLPTTSSKQRGPSSGLLSALEATTPWGNEAECPQGPASLVRRGRGRGQTPGPTPGGTPWVTSTRGPEDVSHRPGGSPSITPPLTRAPGLGPGAPPGEEGASRGFTPGGSTFMETPQLSHPISPQGGAV